MPELPELQALVEALTPEVRDRRVADVTVRHPASLKTVEPPLEAVSGRRLLGVERRGKLLLVRFEGGLSLVLHLMQAGRFGLREAGAPAGGRQTALRIELDDGRALVLRELGTRRQASVHLLDDQALTAHRPLVQLGPEPVGLPAEEWRRALVARPARLHGALRDGRRVAGIGRCYASEIMWAARLAPFAMTDRLNMDAWERLAAGTEAVLSQALERARVRIGLDMPQREERTTAVHRHAGEPCLRCGAELARVSFAQYELVYCPPCQTGGRRYADRRMSRLMR